MNKNNSDMHRLNTSGYYFTVYRVLEVHPFSLYFDTLRLKVIRPIPSKIDCIVPKTVESWLKTCIFFKIFVRFFIQVALQLVILSRPVEYNNLSAK
jgi:hypothetical protein